DAVYEQPHPIITSDGKRVVRRGWRLHPTDPLCREEIRSHRGAWRAGAPIEIHRGICASQDRRTGERTGQRIRRTTVVVVVLGPQPRPGAGSKVGRCDLDVQRGNHRCSRGSKGILVRKDDSVSRPSCKHLASRRRVGDHIDRRPDGMASATATVDHGKRASSIALIGRRYGTTSVGYSCCCRRNKQIGKDLTTPCPIESLP